MDWAADSDQVWLLILYWSSGSGKALDLAALWQISKSRKDLNFLVPCPLVPQKTKRSCLSTLHPLFPEQETQTWPKSDETLLFSWVCCREARLEKTVLQHNHSAMEAEAATSTFLADKIRKYTFFTKGRSRYSHGFPSHFNGFLYIITMTETEVRSRVLGRNSWARRDRYSKLSRGWFSDTNNSMKVQIAENEEPWGPLGTHSCQGTSHRPVFLLACPVFLNRS